MPQDGILLTTKLAELLGVRPGQTLAVEVLEGKRQVRQIPVAGTVDELIGLSAYMNIDALNKLMDEGSSSSGAFLMVDDPAIPHLYAQLKQTAKQPAKQPSVSIIFDPLILPRFWFARCILLGRRL